MTKNSLQMYQRLMRDSVVYSDLNFRNLINLKFKYITRIGDIL